MLLFLGFLKIAIERAMVKWMKQIQGNLQVQFGKNIPESEILKVIIKQPNFLLKTCANLVRDVMREQLHFLELELEERQYDIPYISLISVEEVPVRCGIFPRYVPVLLMTRISMQTQKGMSF